MHTGASRIVLGVLTAFLALAAPATAACYPWPLRAPLAYDGDTVYVTIPELPPELQDVSVRLLNIDAPELRGACEAEKAAAREARDALRAMLRRAREVVICPIGWDRWGGRIDATVWADGVDVGEQLARLGLVRPYDGGRREPWCP